MTTPGLFIVGSDTDVGKTYVTALIAKTLTAAGVRVGVYKPVASGCELVDGRLISGDAVALWEAAGCPGELADVCPQCFAAPLAPHLAAAEEGKKVDVELLRSGWQKWTAVSDLVLVEGAGGLMSPISDEDYVADLALDLKLPLVVVAANKIGVINQTLQTLITAAAFCDGLEIAGVVLNDAMQLPDDPSITSNASELEARCTPPLLAHVTHGATGFQPAVDWAALARAEN